MYIIDSDILQEQNLEEMHLNYAQNRILEHKFIFFRLKKIKIKNTLFDSQFQYNSKMSLNVQSAVKALK